jgi:hypothetical protein
LLPGTWYVMEILNLPCIFRNTRSSGRTFIHLYGRKNRKMNVLD